MGLKNSAKVFRVDKKLLMREFRAYLFRGGNQDTLGMVGQLFQAI